MATRVIDDAKLQNIAVAIQAKDNGGQMTVDEMPGRIALLPAAPVESPALILWDWEGTKLAEFDKTAALALTALPAPGSFPYYAYADHDLLLFQEWNWSIANIKTWIQNHEGETHDVGAIYTTTDGQNHNFWGNPRLDTAAAISIQKRGTSSIGYTEFNNYNSLRFVNIPNGVTSIGNYAFNNCAAVKWVNIPQGVRSIGNSVFTNCYSLEKACIPNSVTSIGTSAFRNCHTLEITGIPDGVTGIGESTFYSCVSIKKFTIPGSVTSIGASAFQFCYSMARVNIPGNVTSIGAAAFGNCKALCDVLIEAKPALANVNAFDGLPTNYRLYVPRANLSWFQAATNWSTLYSQHIVAIEDNLVYLESIGFNVDAYKEAA